MLDADFLQEYFPGAEVEKIEQVQSLWSGYGNILRLHLDNAPVESVILKRVVFPNRRQHPRGWSSDFSHQRKIKSYEVETHWYQQYASSTIQNGRLAACYGQRSTASGVEILLEDLDGVGYSGRYSSLNFAGAKRCLQWLACFHAHYMGVPPEGLWQNGSYWHLGTRPEEFEAMEDGPIKQKAAEIDQSLSAASFMTLVHGDAKVANFCFSVLDESVAAVDFQYVGGGCGMKDVAYFLGSCLTESECDSFAELLLDFYFSVLTEQVALKHPAIDYYQLEVEWRSLYALAWTDFYRFLLGWSPQHHKIHQYTRHQADKALASLSPD